MILMREIESKIARQLPDVSVPMRGFNDFNLNFKEKIKEKNLGFRPHAGF